MDSRNSRLSAEIETLRKRVAEIEASEEECHKAKDECHKAKEELAKSREDLQIETWGLSRTNDAIKSLYKELEEAQDKLTKANADLKAANKKLEKMALTDSHTGLYNHRYLEEILDVEFARAKRTAYPLSVIMMDLDYFKAINDAYGHQFGDLVLKQLGGLLRRKLRKYDAAIRFGGEEFIVVSSGLDKIKALLLAQRIFDAVNERNFGDRKHMVRLKVSMGISSYPEDMAVKGMDLVDIADKNLCKAKEDGGHRIYQQLTGAGEGDGPAKPMKMKEDEHVTLLKSKVEKLNKRASNSLVESVFALAKTVEAKDNYTSAHIEKRIHYAVETAKALNLSADEVESIKQASALHDLGKAGISESILRKRSRLTNAEFEEIRKHPQIGADILRPIQLLHDVVPMVFYHHERWDGKGYPGRLRKKAIPMGARIIAIADVYQALISDRPYRKAYSAQMTRRIIRRESGAQFDPEIVDAFLKVTKQSSYVGEGI